VLRSGTLVHGPVTVSAGALVSTFGLGIAVAAGDDLNYVVGTVSGVSGLWVQLDGADA